MSALGAISVRYCRGKHQAELCPAPLGWRWIKAQARICQAVSRGGSGLAAALGLGGAKL